MRGVRLPHKPIWAALAVGLVLIAFALFVQKAGTLPDQNGQLAVVTSAPERSYVPVVDEDRDGIPDWQQALVRTELIATSSLQGEEWNPTTLTEQFSVAFFEEVVSNETYGPLSDTNDEIVTAATEALVQQAVDPLFTAKDITVAGASDTESLRFYGNALADILLKHPYTGASEMVVLQNALRANNPALLAELAPIENAYRAMVVDMRLLPVPEAYATEHLNLLNSYFAIANDISAMQGVFTDPILAMLRVKRYENDVFGMTQSLISVSNKLVSAGVVYGSEDSMSKLLPTNN